MIKQYQTGMVGGMKLAEYLALKEITHAAFAEKIGTTQATVSRYASGARLPRPAVLDRIKRVTGGAVTANDFYDRRERVA